MNKSTTIVTEKEIAKMIDNRTSNSLQSQGVIDVIATNEKIELFGEVKMGSVDFINPATSKIKYEDNPLDICRLFTDTYAGKLRYVTDACAWFYYNGHVWIEDKGNLVTSQAVKRLVAYLIETGNLEHAKSLMSKGARDTLIKDSQDINPLSLSDFDKDPYLLNCQNITLNLQTGKAQEHNPNDFISKVANVNYDSAANCLRWDKFIFEIMCDDKELQEYLQIAKGYGISGETREECFFVDYGPRTRNGKGTLNESISYILGDYSKNIQPNSLARNNSSGSSPSPDIARLNGVRYVNASEPSSDMKLNSALVKQMTGGDTITARFLYKNSFQYKPQFTIYINTNHLPEINDDSIFASGRVKIIPFDRHFSDAEQDKGLKNYFREEMSKSAILNWLIKGYELYKTKGFSVPKRAEELVVEYRSKSDPLALYVEDRLVPSEDGNWQKTSIFHDDYIRWANNADYKLFTLKEFVGSLRQKNLLTRDRQKGHVIKGYLLKSVV